MAVVISDGVKSGIVLLRGYPASGGDTFAAAVTLILNHSHGGTRQWVADIDNPGEAGSLASFVAGVPAGAVGFLKTHLTREAFERRYRDLLPRVTGEIRLFRSPLDAALASHAYLMTIPGALSKHEHAFPSFIEQWLEREGNCDAFVLGEFASWAMLARDALQEQPAQNARPTDIAFDDLMRSPIRTTASAIGVAIADVEPLLSTEVAPVSVPFAASVASGAFADALGSAGIAQSITGCIDRFGNVVNQLIRCRRIGLSLL